MSARDIHETLKQLYGAEVSAATISTVTDKVWSLVEICECRGIIAYTFLLNIVWTAAQLIA